MSRSQNARCGQFDVSFRGSKLDSVFIPYLVFWYIHDFVLNSEWDLSSYAFLLFLDN